MKQFQKELTLMLVDDEEDIRDVLGITLSDIGYNVHAVENGEEAIRVFKKINPMIVLTDIKMPGIDGIELLKRIKRENPDTEVIMITGHGDMNLAIKSLKYKATDFITKPINVDSLEIALKRALDKIVMRKQLKEYTENLEILIREKTKLQDHLSSLGLMIGSISHGIKGLLTGLDGGMYLLDSGFKKKDQDEVKEGIHIVKFIVERIRKMVLDILFYAKERELKLERINAPSFARDVSLIMEPKMKRQGIEFSCEFDPGAGDFEVDTGFVNAALINILENAMDACTNDRGKKKHRVVFSVNQDGNNIIFNVIDNGVGMDLEMREKMFTLFYSSKGGEGTGLGLFISNKIIRQHGGKIKVKSKPGYGTQFTVLLPKSHQGVAALTHSNKKKSKIPTS